MEHGVLLFFFFFLLEFLHTRTEANSRHKAADDPVYVVLQWCYDGGLLVSEEPERLFPRSRLNGGIPQMSASRTSQLI